MRMKIILYGGNGYIGKQLKVLFEKRGDIVICPKTRLESRTIACDLDEHRPHRVISCTGRTHGMSNDGTKSILSIDYLEQPGKVDENIKDNLYGPVHLALLCHQRGIHYTYVGTGCIYTSPYDENGEVKEIYTEDDIPNFKGSSYSLVKGYTDQLLTHTELARTTLTLRIRLPITGQPHSRNTITKLVSYKQIHSVQNSITCFTLLPIMVDMIIRGFSGPFNFCNKGSISNGRIMELYKEYVDPTHTFTDISGDELAKKLPAKRSNTILDTSKLEKIYPDLETAESAIKKCLVEYAKNMRED